MRPFRRDILDENFEEAAFLCRLREGAFHLFSRTLDSLAQLDERLLGHLYGLEIAGADGWDASKGGLGSKRMGEAFVGSYLALSSPSPDAVDTLATALTAPAGSSGHRLGLRMARGPRALETLKSLTRRDEMAVRASAWDALAFRGEARKVDELADFVSSEDPSVVRNGLEIASRLRPRGLEVPLRKALQHSVPSVAAAAYRAGLFLGLPEAIAAGPELASCEHPRAPSALSWLAWAGGSEVHTALAGAAQSASTRREALLALGRHGHPSAAALLVDATGDKVHARTAGHALELLFGVDLAAEGLALADEKISPAAPEDLDPDDDFVWPDPEKIRAWWSKRSGVKESSPRLRGATAVSWEGLLAQARDASLPTREATLLECRLRLPSIDPFETRDWAREQQRAFPRMVEQVRAASKGRPANDWPTLVGSK